jgi:hypothetical protein
MSRRQRPLRRLASSRAARRRRQSHVPPERLPAPTTEEMVLSPRLDLPERLLDRLELASEAG